MTLNGNIDAGTWSVTAESVPSPEGGYGCLIHVEHTGPEAQFTHTFAHHSTFENETDAVLDGLREGMLWIELKSRHAFHV